MSRRGSWYRHEGGSYIPIRGSVLLRANSHACSGTGTPRPCSSAGESTQQPPLASRQPMTSISASSATKISRRATLGCACGRRCGRQWRHAGRELGRSEPLRCVRDEFKQRSDAPPLAAPRRGRRPTSRRAGAEAARRPPAPTTAAGAGVAVMVSAGSKATRSETVAATAVAARRCTRRPGHQC